MSLPGWLLRQPIAHRGLHSPGPSAPENTMAALGAAQAYGYAAEIDVQLSADGEVVVFHDRDLKRLTGVSGRLADRPSRSLERLRIKGGVETLPLLRDVVQALPDLPLLVELKLGDSALAPAVAAVLDSHPGAFAVQSFDPALVAWFAENRPNWARGLITFTRLHFSLRWPEPRFRRSFIDDCRPDFLAWYVQDLPQARALSAGLPVLTWTVRSGTDRRLARQFADNAIFEGYLA